MPTTKQVLIGALSTVAVGGICYAIYFDYKRRNDPQFRKELKKQRKLAKKLRNAEKKTKEKSSLKIESQIEAIKKIINDEPIPTEMENRESFFVQQLQKGEMLSYQGEPYYEVSALCYYRAFKVYTNPTELILLFQRSIPQPIYKKVIEMIAEDVKKKQEEYFNMYPNKEMNVKIDKENYNIILTKDVAAGEVIYKENPIISSLDPRVENTNYCSHCLKRFDGEGVKGKDKNVIFCSKECSEESWEKYNKYLYQPTMDELSEAIKNADHIEITNVESVVEGNPETIDAKESEPSEKKETTANENENENEIKTDETNKNDNDEENKKDENVNENENENENKKDEEEKEKEEKEEKPTSESTNEDIEKFWKLLKETKKKCPMMIARFVAKMIDRELNNKTQNEEYSDWDHLERFKSVKDLKSTENDIKELELIQSIIGKHSNEILPNEYYNMLKGRFLYNIYSIPANQKDIDLDITSDELCRYVDSRPVIGAGLYHISSFIHHSNTPNVEVKFLDNNNVLSLVAINDLKEGDVLNVKYIDVEGKSDEECNALYKEKYRTDDDEEKVEEKVEEKKTNEEEVKEEKEN